MAAITTCLSDASCGGSSRGTSTVSRQASECGTGLFDAHNHAQLHPLGIEEVLTRSEAAGVVRMCVNGTSPEDWSAVSEAAKRHPPLVVPHFGLHPMHAQQHAQMLSDDDMRQCSDWLHSLGESRSAEAPPAAHIDPPAGMPAWLSELCELLLQHPRAHVGETGLHKPGAGRGDLADMRLQRQCLRLHLLAAQALRRCVTVHCVKAYGALLHDLQSCAARGSDTKKQPLEQSGHEPSPPLGVPVVCHSYSGSAEVTRQLSKLGTYFSISGSVTNPRYKAVRAAAAHVPLGRLLLETDCPDQPLWGGARGGPQGQSSDPQCKGGAAQGSGPAHEDDGYPQRASCCAQGCSGVGGSPHSAPCDVRTTGAEVAQLRGSSGKEVLQAAAKNAQELFCGASTVTM